LGEQDWAEGFKRIARAISGIRGASATKTTLETAMSIIRLVEYDRGAERASRRRDDAQLGLVTAPAFHELADHGLLER
jgi:hypothetical protein